MRTSPSRREFLKAGAAAVSLSAASYARAAGANDRLYIGIIGCGQRGRDAHMKGIHAHAKAQNVEIIAVADPWSLRREEASALCKEWYGRAAHMFSSYRDLLAVKDLDAVTIASPDHVHTLHLEAAAKAKKDVYCEKPLSLDLDSLKRACDAVKAAGVVCQIGTQVRSMATSTGCRELFQSGILGKVSRIEQVRNSSKPYWYSRLADAQEKDVDWKEFLFDQPMRPFRADVFTAWYGYRDFSDGPVPGYGAHFIDLFNYIVGSTVPTSAVGLAGTFVWKDEHELTCPDQAQATWIYPEGFMVSYATNMGQAAGSCLRICCENGVIDLSPWTAPTYSREGAIKPSKLPGKKEPVNAIDTPDHFLDWLQCIRSRGVCRAPIDAGYNHAVATIMGVKAADTGRRQVYDAQRREIREG